MDINSFVLFLVLGIVLVAVDGQIIYRAGSRYLENSYTDDSSAGSMSRLVSVLFHLAVLGVLALLSTIDFVERTREVDEIMVPPNDDKTAPTVRGFARRFNPSPHR